MRRGCPFSYKQESLYLLATPTILLVIYPLLVKCLTDYGVLNGLPCSSLSVTRGTLCY